MPVEAQPLKMRSLAITGLVAVLVTAGLGLAVETWGSDGAFAHELAADAQLDAERAARGWLPSEDPAVRAPATGLAASHRVELLVAREPFVLQLPHGPVRGGPPVEVPAAVAATVAAELARYPAHLLHRAGLWRVVLCDDLTEGVVPIPSLPNVDHGLLVDVSARGDYLRRLIHHEVFHVLDLADDGVLQHDPTWQALNEPGFAYGHGGRSMRRPSAAAVGGPPGFITPYATSAVEEDKAETFAFALADPATLRAKSATDPILAAKTRALRNRLVAYEPTLQTLFTPADPSTSRRGLHSPSASGRKRPPSGH